MAAKTVTLWWLASPCENVQAFFNYQPFCFSPEICIFLLGEGTSPEVPSNTGDHKLRQTLIQRCDHLSDEVRKRYIKVSVSKLSLPLVCCCCLCCSFLSFISLLFTEISSGSKRSVPNLIFWQSLVSLDWWGQHTKKWSFGHSIHDYLVYKITLHFCKVKIESLICKSSVFLQSFTTLLLELLRTSIRLFQK